MGLGVAYLLLSCAVLIAANSNEKLPNYRLPEKIQPLDYVVQLLIEGDIGTEPVFKGHSSVNVQVLSPTSEIVLHAAEHVLIHSVTVYNATTNISLDIKGNSYDKITEMYTIKLQELKKDERLTIVTDYVGKLHDDMYGFYRSSYQEEDKTW